MILGVDHPDSGIYGEVITGIVRRTRVQSDNYLKVGIGLPKNAPDGFAQGRHTYARYDH
jgi:hypothetical protein